MNDTIITATISDEFFDSISNIELTMTIMMILMILIVGRRENRNINKKESINITNIIGMAPLFIVNIIGDNDIIDNNCHDKGSILAPNLISSFSDNNNDKRKLNGIMATIIIGYQR